MRRTVFVTTTGRPIRRLACGLAGLLVLATVGCPPTDPPGTNGTPDPMPTGPEVTASDSDGDGVSDAQDNCPDHANPDQADCDGDGTGDVCTIALGLPSDCVDRCADVRCASGKGCNPRTGECIDVVTRSIRGQIEVAQFSQAQVAISDRAGSVRLRWAGVDTTSPSLVSFEGTLPGMLPNTTTQVDIDLSALPLPGIGPAAHVNVAQVSAAGSEPAVNTGS